MGTYQERFGSHHSRLTGGALPGLEDFVSSFPNASEIEYINLTEMKEIPNMPLVFFLINAGIDQLIEDMKERIPDRVPLIKEYKSIKE